MVSMHQCEEQQPFIIEGERVRLIRTYAPGGVSQTVRHVIHAGMGVSASRNQYRRKIGTFMCQNGHIYSPQKAHKCVKK
jgi:hypothetical protein